MTIDPALIAAAAALLTAIAGVLAATGLGIKNGTQLASQGDKLATVHTLVDGQLAAVRTDLRAALGRADQLFGLLSAVMAATGQTPPTLPALIPSLPNSTGNATPSVPPIVVIHPPSSTGPVAEPPTAAGPTSAQAAELIALLKTVQVGQGLPPVAPPPATP